VGKGNAIHQAELCDRLNTTPSTAKAMIRSARRQGVEILSGIPGYWIAENDQEKKDFVRLMRKQALSRLVSAGPIRKTLNNINGQMTLNEIMSNEVKV